MIFGRVKWEGYHQKHNKKISSLIIEGKPGYSRIDFALAHASWIVHDSFEDGFSRKRIKQFRTPTAMKKLDWTKTKCKIEDARKMSTYIKRAARLFGASLVGVCKLNRKWLYAKVKLPRKFENVIVMAVEMDANGIATSPTAIAAAATGVGYSIDAERCYLYWQKNGTDCSTCIKVCPYNISTSGKHKLSPEEFWKENL